MWEAIRQSADIDWLRQDAERRLMQLDALDEHRRAAARASMPSRAARGSRRPDWRPLVRARATCAACRSIPAARPTS